MSLPHTIAPKYIRQAASSYDDGDHPKSFESSTKFDLIIEGNRYPPKAITALAVQAQDNATLQSSDFSAGVSSKCFRLLREAGFRVVPKPGVIPFIEGSEYTRAKIAGYLGTTENTTKGDWGTGYHFYSDPEASIEGWWFVFAAVDTPARTGHDYENGWKNGLLAWQSKPNRALGQQQIDSLLSGQWPVLIFTRSDARTPFTYNGLGTPHSIEDTSPVGVTWQVADGTRPPLPDNAGEALEAYEPDSLDRRESVVRTICARRGQSSFRNKLFAEYGGRCAVTGCDIAGLLEAAHINPYRGTQDNHPDNGILLRADIHTLFDLGLLGFDPTTLTVALKPKAMRGEYRALNGKEIASGGQLSHSALMIRWKQFQEG